MTEPKIVAAAPSGPGLLVESLDLEGQGVARREDGKVVFIDGALPFERVAVTVQRSKNNWEQGTVSEVFQASAQRVTPACPHFGLHAGACGGCKVQHLHPAAQVAVKQRALEDNLWHLGKVRPGLVLPPIHGPAWAYRHRARLSVRHVRKKGVVLVGFHERKSSYVADASTCAVLPQAVSALLLPLRSLIGSMDARETCPQIELACGDSVMALVLRHLEVLSAADLERLRHFAREHPMVQWWLQPKGPDSIGLLDPDGPELAYALPEFGLRMPFRPTDFTQVNPQINQVLVSRALRLLDVQRHERVIDWFCGLGNFTLPLATRAREVLGVEGSAALVARSRQNYEVNKASGPVDTALCATEFVARNLFEMTPQALLADGFAEKWLIDPPREGAFALVKALVDLIQGTGDEPARQGQGAGLQAVAPQRIVYVSCNPATLARDAGLLVHQAGYRCTAAGVVNMFPHTAHVESIAVFERAS
ncbi:MAG: 23S rRNA (uracil(1939)-C(5))-methyltransferase RlmD [Rhodoferax sp.]|nr:23S rRNA (uracil(1939)-C(5))-methyltransferase RlmD [Rhodoferax sp.]